MMHLPKVGEIVTVHHVVDGESYAFAFQVGVIGVEMGLVEMHGINPTSRRLEGIDVRIENQRQAIDRLLQHLTQHCPELRGSGKCSHMEREEAT